MTVAVQKRREYDEYSDAPAPPDGGWGWIIVFASFMLHVIFDGVAYSFGLFYDEFLTYFQEGKSATSWILSLLTGVTNCSGPISSVLTNRYGGRLVTIAGAIISAVCLAVSYFAQNVPTLYGTIGIGVGFGFGLMYLPAIVCVTNWFEKRRSLAVGIAVCGSGVGTFGIAPVVTKLLAAYGWRVSMFYVAGIVLLCAVFGALFRPVESHTLERPRKQSRKPTLASIPELPDWIEAASNETTQYSAMETPTLTSDNLKLKRTSLNFSIGTHNETYKHGPLDKPDAFYQGELMNIPAYREQVSHTQEMCTESRRLSTLSYKRRRSSAAPKKGTICCSPESAHLLAEMLDLALYKDPVFVVFLISNFLTCIGFNVPYVYIVPFAKTLNITKEEAGYLISIIGIANTLGRIFLGYICDLPQINRKQVYIWCLITCGTGTIVAAFLEPFYALALYCCVFGATIGAFVGLSSVIAVDIVGLDKLTNAFGHILLCGGIGSFIGSPIAGWLYDITGSYKPAFYFSGTVIALSGIILFLIYPIQSWKNKNAKNKQENVIIAQHIAEGRRTFSI